MKIKKITTMALMLSLCLMLAATTVEVAGKPATSQFEWWQFYDGWGPALYYGQKVLVHYTSTNRWVLEKQPYGDGWNIEQALTQNGVAEVYDATTGTSFTDSWGVTGLKGGLIDEDLKFRVVENTIGYVETDKTWYHVSQVDELHEWNYHWIIPGVYHYFGSYHNGEWSSEILQP